MSSKLLSKYVTFDQTIHRVLSRLNNMDRIGDNNYFLIKRLLRECWIDDGYKTYSEELEFWSRANNMLLSYLCNPLDKGIDNLIVDKFLKLNVNRKRILFSRIDKVYERYDGGIEIIDYKTGYCVTHSHDFNLNLKSAVLISIVFNKLGVYPDFISYYYLSYNKKFTRQIRDEDTSQVYKFINEVTLRSK